MIIHCGMKSTFWKKIYPDGCLCGLSMKGDKINLDYFLSRPRCSNTHVSMSPGEPPNSLVPYSLPVPALAQFLFHRLHPTSAEANAGKYNCVRGPRQLEAPC
jgi:hypothetical protein